MCGSSDITANLSAPFCENVDFADVHEYETLIGAAERKLLLCGSRLLSLLFR